MTWHCPGCSYLRAQLDPPWASCKGENRLCRQIEVALLERHPKHPILFYRRLTRKLRDGHGAAVRSIEAAKLPRDAAEWVLFARETHSLIFLTAEPAIAGRFRRAGEPCVFGGENSHGLCGERADRIEPSLRVIFDQSLLSTFAKRSRDEVAHLSAWFLERFFRVHPFVDGNGRVGRCILMLAMRDGRWRFSSERPTSRERRRYIQALQLAHRDAPESRHERKRPACKDPYWRLQEWIDRRLVECAGAAEDEAGPPSWE